MCEDKMMMHASCVAIHVRPVEIQVNTRTKFICMLRHGPKWPAASNTVVETQVIAVETQATVAISLVNPNKAARLP